MKWCRPDVDGVKRGSALNSRNVSMWEIIPPSHAKFKLEPCNSPLPTPEATLASKDHRELRQTSV
ncbi:hypothetical protein DM02DRAFT_613653 [Periconia macrospinosa]|uniref:Uncharacterized protein n=1 Tax=Periconia macrospinosa TaxID=97972 RepID=A0A2V1DW49_9PLEO|nr:hypothetical protein DM02DRAFT_613653 [Periconia macrospinosa]